MKKYIFSNKGQAIVETAMILPVILLILLGIIEFGRIFSTYSVITNASREGARYAAANTDDSTVRSKVDTMLSGLNTTSVSVVISPSFSSRTHGQQVSVQVDYNLELITPLISSIVPNPLKLTSRTMMRVE